MDAKPEATPLVHNRQRSGSDCPTTGQIDEALVDNQLRILILEDVAADAELVERELRKGEISFTARRASTREAFVKELKEFSPELILADYSLPAFDGLSALRIASETCPEIPFVFVSGALGEELAIDTLKQGATDYVLKQRMSRLVPAVERALSEASERLERASAEEALRRSEERQRALLEINNAIISNLDRESLFDAIAKAIGKIVAFDRSGVTLLDTEDVLKGYGFAGTPPSKPLAPAGFEFEFPRQGSPLESVYATKQPRIRRDLKNERRIGVEDLWLKEGIRSYVSVPLIAKGEVFGTLDVGSREPGRYSQTDADFVAEAGHQVALAIQNMWAYEEIALLNARLESEKVYLREEIKTYHNFEEIVGRSPSIMKVLKTIETVAPTDAGVLLVGETGTGKELVARAVHNLSPRANEALVTVNCAALPAGLIESELFGHERGAFTGALSRKIGRFELADGGTIFLDEVGDLPLELQPKLLRVLQEGEFERVGRSGSIKVDVRVVAATNKDLQEEVESGGFRADLYYRLNVFPIHLPSLRERKADVPLLVAHFVQLQCARLRKSIETIPQWTMDALMAYPWPGNVRELANVIERAVIVSEGPELQLGDWPPRTVGARGETRMPTLQELERDHILKALGITGWRVGGERGAAALLGLKRTTLQARMEKLGIKRRV